MPLTGGTKLTLNSRRSPWSVAGTVAAMARPAAATARAANGSPAPTGASTMSAGTETGSGRNSIQAAFSGRSVAARKLTTLPLTATTLPLPGSRSRSGSWV